MRYGEDFVAVQRMLKPDWGFDSYEAALRNWIATVAIVEVGYVGEWEKYVNELMARDYLAEIARLSPTSAAAIEDELAIWDDRFKAATEEEAKPHLPGSPAGVGWWQYRSPRCWHRPGSEEIAARSEER